MIYTGYWAKTQEYKKDNLVPVGISGWSPDGYTGKTYKKLAPKYSWWKEWHDNHMGTDWYVAKYNETVLSQLNPYTVIQELTTLGGGHDVILLCFEKPNEFCHRHLVAQWLNQFTNQKIVEYQLKKQQIEMGL